MIITRNHSVSIEDEEITAEVIIAEDGVHIYDPGSGAKAHIGSFADEIDRAIAMLSAAKDYLTAAGTEAL